MVVVKKQSQLTGEFHSLELDMCAEEYLLALKNWNNGMLIQDAFPELSADEREFIKTGITADEWEALWG